jgi:hypothetical protein
MTNDQATVARLLKTTGAKPAFQPPVLPPVRSTRQRLYWIWARAAANRDLL